MSSKPTPSGSGRQQQNIKVADDDEAFNKQINDTHTGDGYQFYAKLNPDILQVVKDICNPPESNVPVIDATDSDALPYKTYQALYEYFVDLVDPIGSKMHEECTKDADNHAITISILKILSRYSWDVKVVIALSAFAMKHREFWLVANTFKSNDLAKSVASLKQLTDVFENSDQHALTEMKKLINVMLKIAKSIVELKKVPAKYNSENISTAQAKIPAGVYWTIRSIVACWSLINGFTGHRHLLATDANWKLSTLNVELSARLKILSKNLHEIKHVEAYEKLVSLFETKENDVVKILEALLPGPRKKDRKRLVKGTDEVDIDVLKEKNVLLLISDLDILTEDIFILGHIMQEKSRLNPIPNIQFEIVWLPIVDQDGTSNYKRRFEEKQVQMNWYSCLPIPVDGAVVKYVKEKWQFGQKTIIVVLDSLGQVVCQNALHMMWIWGTRAFPFTEEREEALWDQNTSWKLDLLFDGIDKTVMDWGEEEKYICIYGGDELDWIQKFTKKARDVADDANIPLEMVYVGRRNSKERVKKIIETIESEKLSRSLQDQRLIWYFWVRIASMWYSKNQLKKTTENDPTMKEIMKMLIFDSESGWAIFTQRLKKDQGMKDNEMKDNEMKENVMKGKEMKDSEIRVEAKGNIILTCLENYSRWKDLIQKKGGFVQALRGEIQKEVKAAKSHCNRLALPNDEGKLPQKIVCADCPKNMEKMIMYRCCD
ncbi:hypothetical protein JCGZ_10222 [Jatropha curcas]|uniref:Uncharacterized protein n=1 Tax=Jatropha curcas TaxID=180498 RepID=A0A067LDB0_JATCU|nr:protein SIEVE ELEMENT OCCLUSION B isoform X2 [Jatropha curcas]KDP46382.1 hypothetical protein JCGZ_10222 [Jatropha curcas]